nr:MAG TPA: hypothetical protein [Caudoviricetes sp.]
MLDEYEQEELAWLCLGFKPETATGKKSSRWIWTVPWSVNSVATSPVSAT